MTREEATKLTYQAYRRLCDVARQPGCALTRQERQTLLSAMGQVSAILDGLEDRPGVGAPPS